MNLIMQGKLETANQLLKMETKDHKGSLSKKLGISYNNFYKIMWDNGNYHYYQSNRRYEKLMSLDEYESYLKLQSHTKHDPNKALQFIKEHLDELKTMLNSQGKQLILEAKVYNLTSKTGYNSLRLNLEIFVEFSKFISLQFPHYRQRKLLSQSLLEFTRKYENAPSE